MLRESLAEQFAASGYEPVVAASVEEARTRGTEGLYEFMILDVSLPDGDGRELCREFRDKGVTCPIIILTQSPGLNRARTITWRSLSVLLF